MGSVKSLEIFERPTAEQFGKGVFVFSDDYSVFDYGKMPDVIPGKGEALARMASWNMQRLANELGIKSHLRGFTAPNRMDVNLVRVLYPGKDEITRETANYLIPLEIIFRNSLPSGSSVFKALDSGELTLEDLGLESRPEPGQKLETPVLDVTTKLEVSDRRIKWDEAQRMSALSDDEMARVRETALKINSFLNKRAAETGLEHADGKVELGLGPDREIVLVDVCGTPDENRFLFNGFHISKQVLRDYYNKTPWAEEVTKAIKTVPKEQWPAPQKLPEGLISAVSNMYRAVCEEWTGEKVWNASLQESINRIREFV